jgi:hypothetical protein
MSTTISLWACSNDACALQVPAEADPLDACGFVDSLADIFPCRRKAGHKARHFFSQPTDSLGSPFASMTQNRNVQARQII